jgi:hypothetical protein
LRSGQASFISPLKELIDKFLFLERRDISKDVEKTGTE